jgi:hypothetical protein
MPAVSTGYLAMPAVSTGYLATPLPLLTEEQKYVTRVSKKNAPFQKKTFSKGAC